MAKNFILSYADMKYPFERWWRHASQSVREEIIADLQKVRLPEGDIYGTNCKFAVNYSDRIWELGEACVYALVSKDYDILYIGCGDAYRPHTIMGRNREIEVRYKSGGIEPYIICLNVDKEVALKIETFCIWKAQFYGWKITNKAKLLSEKDIISLRCCCDSSEAFRKYLKMAEEHADVAKAFDDLSYYCLQKQKCGEKFDDERTIKKPMGSVRRIKHMWTIDGEIKPAIDWCRMYEKNYGEMIERVANLGCTPKEALTFPSNADGSKNLKKLKEFWCEQGIVPSVDTTSWVTPHADWPDCYVAIN